MIKLEYEKLYTLETVLCESTYMSTGPPFSLTPVSTQCICFYDYRGGDYRDCCLPETDAV